MLPTSISNASREPSLLFSFDSGLIYSWKQKAFTEAMHFFETSLKSVVTCSDPDGQSWTRSPWAKTEKVTVLSKETERRLGVTFLFPAHQSETKVSSHLIQVVTDEAGGKFKETSFGNLLSEAGKLGTIV